MAADEGSPFATILRKLGRLADLNEEDRQAIAALPFIVSHVAAGRYMVREGDTVSTCCMLLDGYACRHKTTSGGSRQIVSFHLPGDILDLQHLLLTRADHNVQTITRATVATVPSEQLRQVSVDRPRVAEALWRDALIDASIFREWVLNVGRRDARTRIAHMLCEFAVRREAAGLGKPERFELPMTQEQIADAVGLTPVHVNRMLNALEREGAIARDKRDLQITDWKRMRQIADFDPDYLHAAA